MMVKGKVPLDDVYAGETVWCEVLGPDLGAIKNLPVFATKYKFRDVVRFNPLTFDCIEVVADGGYTRTKLYEYTGDLASEKTLWEAEGCVVEGLRKGLLAVSCPRRKRPSRSRPTAKTGEAPNLGECELWPGD